MTSTASITRQDHVLGPRKAAVSLLEYGDYECPYCRRADAAESAADHGKFWQIPESGVHGTPTFFINRRRHEGSGDLETS